MNEISRKKIYSAAIILALSFSFFAFQNCSAGGGGGGGSGSPGGSSDTTPPTVVSTVPTSGATGVSPDAVAIVTFSEPIATAVTSANLTFNGVTANATAKCSSAFLFPTTNLSPSTGYTFTITGVSDLAGNVMTSPHVVSFTTGAAAVGPTALATGSYHNLAIKADGTLWAWGLNTFGAIGDGTTTNKLAPVRIGSGTDWSQIEAGNGHSLALKTDGSLWAWGYNSSYGQLGTGTGLDANTPTRVGTGTDWSAIAAGDFSSFGLKSDGTLWAWGWNNAAQLGDGAGLNLSTPTKIGVATTWASIDSSGSHTLALRTDGTLWSWGNGSSGQQGDGGTSAKYSPTQIGSDNDWVEISAGGGFSHAIKSNGTLWGWGSNNFNTVGDGLTPNVLTPKQIGTGTNWAKVQGGLRHVLAIKTDGTLWAWGRNANGALGNGTVVDSTTPIQIGTATNWNVIAPSEEYSLVLNSTSSALAWGENPYGQIGDGTTSTRLSPVQINFSNSAISATAPTGLALTPGNGELSVSWNSVSSATSYDLYYSASSTAVTTSTGTAVNCVTSPNIITGLVSGETYNVIVVASNPYGNSPATAAVSATVTGTSLLDVTLAGTGSGSVSSSPAGISCGSTCDASFATNTSVTLSATAGAGSTFTSWSGACTGSSTCNVTMNGAQDVTATFTSSGGAATIAANPASVALTGTSCWPATCVASQAITIISSTAWTSSTPGFGSLPEGFAVTPSSGAAGTTPVTISYTYEIPSPASGFIRFRTTTIGIYAEVPVTMTTF